MPVQKQSAALSASELVMFEQHKRDIPSTVRGSIKAKVSALATSGTLLLDRVAPAMGTANLIPKAKPSPQW